MSNEQSFPTLPELLDYIEKHASAIYVRAALNGTWGNYALTELPSAVAIPWVLEFIRRGRLPYRDTHWQEVSDMIRGGPLNKALGLRPSVPGEKENE